MIGPRTRAGWHLRANAPAMVWALALLVVALAQHAVPFAGWFLVHLLFLGVAANSILVWSWHFAEALLRGPSLKHPGLAWRLVASMAEDWWPVTLAGSVVIGLAVAAHAVALGTRARKALPSRFGATVRYYIAACLLVPVGAGVGVSLAAPRSAEVHARLVVVHLSVNVLGFVGLTVLGTLMTLLPTMLRTRVADGAESVARRALVPLLAGVVLIAAGAVADVQAMTVLGVLVYLTGVGYVCVPLAKVVLAKPPVAFAPLSAVAALVWLAVALIWLLVLSTTAASWGALTGSLQAVVPALTAGFAAQVLAGALTFLAPVVLGGGPARAKHRIAVLEQAAWLRVTLVNAGLLLFLLPLPDTLRAGAAILVVAGLAWTLPLLIAVVWLKPALPGGGVPGMDAAPPAR